MRSVSFKLSMTERPSSLAVAGDAPAKPNSGALIVGFMLGAPALHCSKFDRSSSASLSNLSQTR